MLKIYAGAFGICTGGQESSWPFDGNDLPGIFAGRGVARFASREGIAVGKRVVVVAAHRDAIGVAQDLEGQGSRIAAVVDTANVLDAPGKFEVIRAGPVESARGGNRVEKLVVADGKKHRTIPCDAVALCGPAAPAFELAMQAGCETGPHEPSGGFAVRADADGNTSVPGVFAAGHVCGAVDARTAAEQGTRAGAAAARWIKDRPGT
jgi:sarcosine oxidase subunit alpha